jgi:chemotaxis protein MotB
MKKGPPKEEKGESAPLWMISFSDMISLMMAFFVMLLAMTNSDGGSNSGNGDDVFKRSIAGFNNSIKSFGVPELFGKKAEGGGKKQMRHYAIDSNENAQTGQRIISSIEEQTKKLFNQLDAEASTSPSTVKGTPIIFTATPILFNKSNYELKEEDKTYLKQFCSDIKSSSQSGNITIVVIGAAEEDMNFRDKWMVSSQRANAVAEYIKQCFSDSSINVAAWGTNNLSSWAKDSSFSANKTHILLSVLRKD